MQLFIQGFYLTRYNLKTFNTDQLDNFLEDLESRKNKDLVERLFIKLILIERMRRIQVRKVNAIAQDEADGAILEFESEPRMPSMDELRKYWSKPIPCHIDREFKNDKEQKG